MLQMSRSTWQSHQHPLPEPPEPEPPGPEPPSEPPELPDDNGEPGEPETETAED
jgi:hypothetical protein